MKKLYLKWYYWYKNFGDELLLLWVLTYLKNTYWAIHITIETQDTIRLNHWMDVHAWYFPDCKLSYASSRYETIVAQCKADYLIIWWWEVITDARSIPYNWWNYLLRNYWYRLFWKKIVLLWWFWVPKHIWSNFLYKILYNYANSIVCREPASYERVIQYVSKNKCVLHEDFAYTILRSIKTIHWSSSLWHGTYAIINCNPYIWSAETKQKIINYCSQGWYDSLIYFPAELTIDAPMYNELLKELPNLIWYDRTAESLKTIALLFASASWWIAARLHVLILLQFYWVEYTPLVYQEKITKILWHA